MFVCCLLSFSHLIPRAMQSFEAFHKHPEYEECIFSVELRH